MGDIVGNCVGFCDGTCDGGRDGLILGDMPENIILFFFCFIYTQPTHIFWKTKTNTHI